MENTLENAVRYLEDKYKYKRDRDDHNDKWIHEMVAYASQVSPKLVLPERMKVDYDEPIYYRKKAEIWNSCIMEIIRLNPTILK